MEAITINKLSKCPKLRFEGFSENWKEFKLAQTIELLSGQHLSPDEYIDKEKEKHIPYFTGPTDFTDSREKVSKWTNKQTKVAYRDDVLITVKGSGVGKLFVNSLKQVALGRQLMAINSTNFSNLFIYYKLSTKKNKFQALASGNMIPGLSRSDIKSIKFHYPNVSEQKKIASFLSAADKRIDLLEQKKAKLSAYKKGVMQQIFSREIRFKDEDGKEFPEWRVKRLKEIFTRKIQKNTDNKHHLVLSNSAIEGIVIQSDFFDHQVANKNNLAGYYVVEKDDFVYNPRISNPAPVGPMKRNKIGTGVMSPLYTVLRPKKGNLYYLEFYFQSTFWHHYMNSVANYGARHDRMNISNNDLMNLPIPWPTVEEQDKIADFLISIDQKIEIVEQQIEGSNQFKKGLLQQMFV